MLYVEADSLTIGTVVFNEQHKYADQKAEAYLQTTLAFIRNQFVLIPEDRLRCLHAGLSPGEKYGFEKTQKIN